MSKRDYYEVLGVSRECTEAELKTAYRKLAMQHHPDRNPGDAKAEERFKEAGEAYGVLSDAQKRAAYDRYGHASTSAGFGGGAGPFADAADLGDIFGDLFGEMFGGGGQRRSGSRVQRGEDLRFDITIEFEDAVFGKETEIKVRGAKTAPPATGREPVQAAAPRSAPPARDAASCATSRASFRSRAPATPAAARARLSPIPALPAAARRAWLASSR